MRNGLGFLLPVLLVLLILLVIFGVAFGLITLLITGLAAVLRWFFPFSIFEGMLMATALTACTVYVVLGLIRMFVPVESLRLPNVSGDEGNEYKEYKRIASSRFYKSAETRTWEAWLREEIANDIYVEFQDEPRAVSNMNESQVQELAIRLSELAITILRRKTARARDLTVNVSTLKRELQRMGQRAYDDKILQLTAAAININVDFYKDDIHEIIQTQSWQAPADAPGDE